MGFKKQRAKSIKGKSMGKDNRHKENARTAKRKASKIAATPAWSDLSAVQDFYLLHWLSECIRGRNTTLTTSFRCKARRYAAFMFQQTCKFLLQAKTYQNNTDIGLRCGALRSKR